MRIAFVLGQDGIGGTETQAWLLIRGLRDAGHRVDVYVVEGDSDEKRPADPEAHVLGPARTVGRAGVRGSLVAAWRLRRALRSGKYDVVHAAMARAYVLTGWVKPRGLPLVAWRRNEGVHLRERKVALWVERTSAGHSAVLVCNSEGVRRYWLEAKVGRPETITVIGNALADWRFDAVEPQVGSTHQVILVSVGGLKPVKRHDLVLAAAGEMRDKGVDAEVVLVGDGECRASLEAQAAGLSVPLIITGIVSDTREWLSAATVYVHPSDSEGSSNAIAEALALGVPVVATKVGDAGDVLDGVGLVVPTDDAGAIASAITKVVQDSRVRQTMSLASVTRARERFSLQQCVAAHETIYDRVV